ncbi:hypothetical protein CcaverHIS002_0108250 [Cutaneotrichosporon cavernicola]|nr:hypothetical protein CcaverHIS002_0108250 [Cutaneotrichosporon cavernicola]
MSRQSSPELSDSELLEGLEEKFDMGAERERRMQALRNESQRLKTLNETEYGKVMTYGDEKKLIERMSKDKGVDRLIGFEELGQTDQFSTTALEFRLQQSGALPSGPMSLASMLGKIKKDSDDEDDDDAFRDKSRRGKVGIRNGLAFGNDDE